ncbi:LysR family transcriptional regulator [Oscillospiraceae bacterium LTW-04]|nr:LysR family transcriptional regulator [Oscillospiraceae bacterium MB24-C1]
MLTLQQLKYFCVMAETLHYTEAAQKLYISQSSLSYALSKLEEELDAPLFEKRGKQTVLSKYGQGFLPYATQALDAVDAGVRHISQMLQSNSVINLGYIYSLSFNYLPKVIKGFRTQPGNSAVSFKFFQGLSSVIMQKLKRGELDLALSVEPGDDDTISAMPVHLQELYLVVPNSHPLASFKSVSVDDMRDETFVGITPSSGLYKHLSSIFDSLGFTCKIAFEAEECNSMASFVSAGFGVAVMPEIPSFQSYRVKAIPIADERFCRQIYLLWAKDHFSSPAIEHFKSFICKPLPEADSIYV